MIQPMILEAVRSGADDPNKVHSYISGKACGKEIPLSSVIGGIWRLIDSGELELTSKRTLKVPGNSV